MDAPTRIAAIQMVSGPEVDDNLMAAGRLLAHAVRILRPGGLLVYATCSLLSEEGENQTDALLASGAPVRRDPVAPEELPALKGAITAKGELRTLPSMLPDPDPQLAGLDGFFAARLIRL